MRAALVGIMLMVAAPLSAQRMTIDPDWCWSCSDSQQHFVAGAGVDLAANLLLPKSKAWQRILITTVVAAGYELGQADASSSSGQKGPGYGFGPKDLLLGVGGAVCVELVRVVLR